MVVLGGKQAWDQSFHGGFLSSLSLPMLAGWFGVEGAEFCLSFYPILSLFNDFKYACCVVIGGGMLMTSL